MAALLGQLGLAALAAGGAVTPHTASMRVYPTERSRCCVCHRWPEFGVHDHTEEAAPDASAVCGPGCSGAEPPARLGPQEAPALSSVMATCTATDDSSEGTGTESASLKPAALETGCADLNGTSAAMGSGQDTMSLNAQEQAAVALPPATHIVPRL